MTPLQRCQSRIRELCERIRRERRKTAVARLVRAAGKMGTTYLAVPIVLRRTRCEECHELTGQPLIDGCCGRCLLELATPARRER